MGCIRVGSHCLEICFDWMGKDSGVSKQGAMAFLWTYTAVQLLIFDGYSTIAHCYFEPSLYNERTKLIKRCWPSRVTYTKLKPNLIVFTKPKVTNNAALFLKTNTQQTQ